MNKENTLIKQPSENIDVNDLMIKHGLSYVNQQYKEMVEPQVDNLIATVPDGDVIDQIIKIVTTAGIKYEKGENNMLIFNHKELEGYRYNFNNMKLEYHAKEEHPYISVSEIIIYTAITINNEGLNHHCLAIVNENGSMIADIMIPADIEPQNLLKKLYSKGLKIHYDNKKKGWCREFILRCNNVVTLQQDLKSEINNGFLDQTTYLFANKNRPVFIGENIMKYRFEHSKSTGRQINGSLDEWKKNIADDCVGNPLFEFVVMVGFSGMVLQDLDIKLSTGFHIYSQVAGNGKTTLARVAASVMGNPSYNVHQWNQTANNLDLILAKSNDGFLALDEIKQLKSNVLLSDIIMKIGNGDGAGRMAQDAKSSREQFKWRLYYLSTGNYPTEDIKNTREHEHMIAAEEARLYNIPMMKATNLHDKNNIQDFLTNLNHNVDKYHGIAGYQFITNYLANYSNTHMELKRHYNRCKCRITLEYKDKDIPERLITTLASIYAAGEMAKFFNILPKEFAPEKTIDSILKYYCDTRGANRDHVIYLQKLFAIVSTNKKQYLEYATDGGFKNSPMHYYGYIDGNYAYIITKNFADTFGLNNFKGCQEIRNYLIQQKVLILDADGNDSKQHSDGKRYSKIDIVKLTQLVG